MDDLGRRIKHITNELKHYVETKIELTIINVSDQIAYWIGKAIQNLFGYTILAFGLIFGLTALSIFLSELIGQKWAGYLIVSAPFLLVGLVLVMTKPTLIARKVQHEILSELLSSFDEEDADVKKISSKSTPETLNKKSTSSHGE